MFTGWLQLHPPSTATTTTCSLQPPFELRHVHVRLFVFTLAPQAYCTCCGVAVASVLGAVGHLPPPPLSHDDATRAYGYAAGLQRSPVVVWATATLHVFFFFSPLFFPFSTLPLFKAVALSLPFSSLSFPPPLLAVSLCVPTWQNRATSIYVYEP